ncbi:hypothetical protein TWF696_008646 [Orbilia brochopaga]|uniref:Uncharacterized protein n=1 Tax=Orbilia brochopaga TaxID=3140254 RepID=A0AAV9UHQ0_9PEZI
MFQKLFEFADTLVSCVLIFVAAVVLVNLAPECRSSGPANPPLPPLSVPRVRRAQSPPSPLSRAAVLLAMSFAKDKRFVLTKGVITLRKTTTPSRSTPATAPRSHRRVGVFVVSKVSRFALASSDSGSSGPSEVPSSSSDADTDSLRSGAGSVLWYHVAEDTDDSSVASIEESGREKYLATVSRGQRAAFARDRARRRASAAAAGWSSRIPRLAWV